MKLHQALLIAFACVGLAACGGNDDGDAMPTPSTPTEVPDSALISATAYQQFAGSLMNSETAAPLDVNKVSKPPVSETLAPANL
jgi:hypothetical protein